MAEIAFDITPEPEGGFTAAAQVGPHSLVTYGGTLDELREMIRETLALYCENSGSEVGRAP